MTISRPVKYLAGFATFRYALYPLLTITAIILLGGYMLVAILSGMKL